MRSDLERVVRPAISDRNALASAQMIADILDYLIVWHRAMCPGSSRNWMSASARCHRRALRTPGGGCSPSQHQRNGVLQGLERLIERGALDRARMSEAVAVDLALFDEENRLRAAGQLREAAEHDGIEVEVTAARLQALVGPLCGGTRRQVATFNRVYGGYSKDTFLFRSPPVTRARSNRSCCDVICRSGLREQRSETSSRCCGTCSSVASRWRSRCSSIRKATTWAARDGVASGDGGPAPTNGRPDPVRRDGIVRQLACIVARLHAQTPADLGLVAAPGEASDTVRAHPGRSGAIAGIATVFTRRPPLRPDSTGCWRMSPESTERRSWCTAISDFTT